MPVGVTPTSGCVKYVVLTSATQGETHGPFVSWRGAGADLSLEAPLLHLGALGADPVVQLLHHLDERAVLLPERRIVALLLDQQGRNAGAR